MMNKRVLRGLVGAGLLVAVGVAIALRDQMDVAALQAWVDAAGAAGPLVFMILYALATVLLLPGSVLTLAGGALFGPVWGTLWNLTGATAGAAIAFLMARYLGADWVTRRAEPRLARLSEGVTDEGWRFIAFVRLVPVFPFNLLNYALGLTRIPFVTYVVATWLFMLPGALAYTWLGYAGREALGGGAWMISNILIALALLSAVAFLPRFMRKLRQEPRVTVDTLKQQLDAGEELLVLDVRPAADFTGEQGHIASARNVPLENLTAHLSELDGWRQRSVRLICRTDRRSTQAAQVLSDAGFADAKVIKGGMTEWNSRGWPVIVTS